MFSMANGCIFYIKLTIHTSSYNLGRIIQVCLSATRWQAWLQKLHWCGKQDTVQTTLSAHEAGVRKGVTSNNFASAFEGQDKSISHHKAKQHYVFPPAKTQSACKLLEIFVLW